MAGSRQHTVGSIFSRITGLIRAGALKDIDKPLWYDVYAAFPPAVSPQLDRAVSEDPVPNIVYQEDYIREKYYRTFKQMKHINMADHRSTSESQKFINKFVYIAYNESERDANKLFDMTVEALHNERVLLLTHEDARQNEQRRQEREANIIRTMIEDKKSLELQAQRDLVAMAERDESTVSAPGDEEELLSAVDKAQDPTAKEPEEKVEVKIDLHDLFK